SYWVPAFAGTTGVGVRDCSTRLITAARTDNRICVVLNWGVFCILVMPDESKEQPDPCNDCNTCVPGLHLARDGGRAGQWQEQIGRADGPAAVCRHAPCGADGQWHGPVYGDGGQPRAAQQRAQGNSAHVF